MMQEIYTDMEHFLLRMTRKRCKKKLDITLHVLANFITLCFSSSKIYLDLSSRQNDILSKTRI